MQKTIPSLRLLEALSVLLFFVQALRVLFSVMFGIIYDQLFAGSPDAWLIASNLLVIAALAAPAIGPRRPGPAWLSAVAIACALGRLALTVNDAEIRFWAALVVVGSGGIYLAGLNYLLRPLALPALLGALALDQGLRVMGNSYDLSLRSEWLPFQAIWLVILVGLSAWLSRRQAMRSAPAGGLAWTAALALGGILFLETSLLSLPNAAARWSGNGYAFFAPALMALTLAPLLPPVHKDWIPTLSANRPARLALAVVLLICLLVGYFTTGWEAVAALLIAHAVTLLLLGCVLASRSPRAPWPGRGQAIGMFFYLLLVYFNAFAFTYPYALPFMRGLGWAVYLVAGLAVLWGIAVPRGRLRRTEEWMNIPGWFGAGAALLVGVALLWGVWEPIAALKSDPAVSGAGGILRIATYNIHYGYDEHWRYTLDEMAEAIEAAGVDIIALQEVDTGRLTSYGVDNALYLSRRLGMQAVYVPAVEHLTGIALLYRPAARQAAWTLLPSLQEQTGLAYAHLNGSQRGLHAYGVWMGLSQEDTLAQIDAALAYIGDASPAVFGGDFNAVPGSPVVLRIQAAGFVDPFVVLGNEPAPSTSPASQPTKQIDYVWVRGLVVRSAWVSPSLASDHRLVVVEVQVP